MQQKAAPKIQTDISKLACMYFPHQYYNASDGSKIVNLVVNFSAASHPTAIAAEREEIPSLCWGRSIKKKISSNMVEYWRTYELGRCDGWQSCLLDAGYCIRKREFGAQ